MTPERKRQMDLQVSGLCIQCGKLPLWTRARCEGCEQKNYPAPRKVCGSCGFAYALNVRGDIRRHRPCDYRPTEPETPPAPTDRIALLISARAALVLRKSKEPLNRQRKWQLRRIAEGRCYRCGKFRQRGDKALCSECIARDANVEGRRVRSAKCLICGGRFVPTSRGTPRRHRPCYVKISPASTN